MAKLTYDFGGEYKAPSKPASAPVKPPVETPEASSSGIPDSALPEIIKPHVAPTTMDWETTLRGIKSLSDDAITYCPAIPWEWDIDPPAAVLTDKSVFRTWCTKPTTEHLFYTGVEALDPMRRVGKENPPEIIHAIVVDYDGITPDEVIDSIPRKLPADLLPTWWSRSRFSGGGRLVWMLEKPLPVGGLVLAEAFLAQAAKELNLKKLAVGYDEESIKPKQTFEVGTNWKRIGGALRPETVHQWFFKAAMRVSSKIGDRATAVEIPLEDVHAEIERQFPGRWTGPFEKGARGVVVNDPTSVNPSAAIVVDEGLVVFGQPKPFYPWREVLGPDFVRKYDEDRIMLATSKIYHDGTTAWIQNPSSNRWENHRDTHLDLHFTVACKLSKEAALEAKHFVIFNRRIEGAAPFVGDPRELINLGGKKMLNTWVNNIMKPAEGVAGEYGDEFPFLKEFFDTRFDPKHDPTGAAKWHLFAWWKTFYKGMLEGKGHNGQAIAIAGGTSIGKTLFLDKMLGASVGGFADASNYLQATTSFNAQLFEEPIWCIDDGSFDQSMDGRRRFSEMVKKCAATSNFEYHDKGRRASQIKWHGRTVILLNTDPESISALPSMDISNKDKINLYRWVETCAPFPPREVVEANIRKELPYLLRWLLAFDPKAQGIAEDARYGVASHIDKKTAEESENASGAGFFENVLAVAFSLTAQTDDVTMDPVDLLAFLNGLEPIRPAVLKMTTRAMAGYVRSLASRDDPTITMSPVNGSWTFHVGKIRARYAKTATPAATTIAL